MLADKEQIAIATWMGWKVRAVGGWACYVFEVHRGEISVLVRTDSIDFDPHAYIPLFERLAGASWGMSLWRHDRGDGLPWICGVAERDASWAEDLVHGRGATIGEAVVRAVLAAIGIAKEADDA